MPIWAYILIGVAWWMVGVLVLALTSILLKKTVRACDVFSVAWWALAGPFVIFVVLGAGLFELHEMLECNDVVIWPPSKWKRKGEK